MRRRSLARAVVGGALLALSLACHSKDLSDGVATVTSWAETVRLAGEAWANGEIPTPYARRTFEAADETIGDELDQLAEAPDLAGRARELRAAIREARNAVDRKDRRGVAAPLDRIADLERSLRSLGAGKGGS